jgi:hypothetical protein
MEGGICEALSIPMHTDYREQFHATVCLRQLRVDNTAQTLSIRYAGVVFYDKLCV